PGARARSSAAALLLEHAKRHSHLAWAERVAGVHRQQLAAGRLVFAAERGDLGVQLGVAGEREVLIQGDLLWLLRHGGPRKLPARGAPCNCCQTNARTWCDMPSKCTASRML